MDRRPLASRGTKLAQETARFFAQKNISPNTISVVSVVFSLMSMLSYYLAKNHYAFLFLAALFIQLRLICNLLDGMIAVEYNKKSIYGNLFNDIPDRFADVFIIMGAGICAQQNETSILSEYVLTFAWINSILAVLTAYIRVLGPSVGTPMFFSGVMAKPQRMAILTVATLLALAPNVKIPFLSLALGFMLVGQCLTVFVRIKLIANSLALREK